MSASGMLATVVWALLATSGSDTKATDPTFNQIAPIIFENCSSCHRPGEAAPFSLLTYRDVQKRGRMIVDVIADGYMPPWHPAEGHGEFQDALRLDDQEVTRIQRWFEIGMPQGDPAKLPAPPQFTEGWQLGEPDLVVRMSEAFPVPAGGPDIYRNFVIPLALEEDRWLTAIEVRPGARGVLHHIVFGLDTTGEARRADGADGQPGFFGMQGRGEIGSGSAGLGGWAVGGTPRKLPLGLATRVPKDADLILRSHFHPSGKAESELTVLGLHFADEPPSHSIVGLQMPPMFGYAAGIDVAPGDAHFQIEDSFMLPVDCLAVTVGGHAHYICTEMQVCATYPDGRRESIFLIDDWDFSWQNRYTYESPVVLPAGTRIDTRVAYDNSADNADNPFDPPRRIGWGLESTDEMGSVTLLLIARNETEVDALRGAIRNDARSKLSGSASRESMVRSFRSRLRMLDVDGDGRVRLDEVPERSRGWARNADRDGDGALTFDEIDRIGERLLAAGRSEREPSHEAAMDATEGFVGRAEPPGPIVRDVQDWAHRPLDVAAVEGRKASVLIFTTVDCPIANSYSPALRELIGAYEKRGIGFYFVHVDQDVTAEDAARHAMEFELPGTVLLDPEHVLVRQTGATRTPEVAVILSGGEIAYRGRIDNWYGDLGKKRPAPTRHELRDALDAILAGKPVTTTTALAVGCTITAPLPTR